MKVAYERSFSLEEIAAMDRTVGSAGYALRRVESGVWDMEHRLVMTSVLGRPLERGESVHHRDGNRGDNRPENLELWAGKHGNGQRASDLLCPHCGRSYFES